MVINSPCIEFFHMWHRSPSPGTKPSTGLTQPHQPTIILLSTFFFLSSAVTRCLLCLSFVWRQSSWLSVFVEPIWYVADKSLWFPSSLVLEALFSSPIMKYELFPVGSSDLNVQFLHLPVFYRRLNWDFMCLLSSKQTHLGHLNEFTS